MIDEDIFAEGTMFDGSSIAGWKAINESDMTLMPDPDDGPIDPFFAQSTLVDLLRHPRAATGEPYNRDPRGTAKKAEAYLQSTGIGDTVYFGPEAEFFIFDDVRFSADPYNTGFKLDSIRTADQQRHRIRGRQPRPPHRAPRAAISRSRRIDSRAGHALRHAERTWREMGVPVEKHHHEVAAAQHELGIKFDTLIKSADSMQIYKYCIHQVAQCLWQDRDLHAEADLRRQRLGHARATSRSGRTASRSSPATNMPTCRRPCLYYIGGIIKHAKAINAFTNPTTNSYKRLVPGYEAPVLLAYSARNRSASCRIPFDHSPKAKRVEVRFPDPAANPYLGFAAMLMAGLDGIKNKIHPGEPWTRTSTTCRRRS